MSKQNLVQTLVITILVVSLLVTWGCSSTPSPTQAPQTSAAPAPKPASSAPATSAAPAPKPAATPAAAQPIVLKIAHTMPPPKAGEVGSKQTEALEFKTLIEARSNGRVKVEIFPSSQLYADKAGYAAAIAGTIFSQIGYDGSMSTYDIAFNIFNMFSLFDDIPHMVRWIQSEKGGKVLEKRMLAKGLIIDWSCAELMVLFTKNKPVTKLTDLQGMRVRVSESELMSDSVKAIFKTDPIILAIGDVYSSAQQGMIDGAVTYFGSISDRGIHEVLNTCMKRPYMTGGAVVHAVSKKQVDALPADLQKMVLDSYHEAANKWLPTLFDEWSAAAFKKMEGKVTYTEMPAAEWAKVKDIYKPVYNKWKPLLGTDLVEEAERLRTAAK